MPLRFAGNCAQCGVRIEQRTEAWYDPAAKKVTCTVCRPVDAQLSVDVEAPPAAPTRTVRTDLQKGTELEQRIAEVFRASGYRVDTNVVREGRSGATHEIDVVAQKTDDLLTMSVAIECKAWANPIEKDVVAKFNEARRDLGLGHAIVVSLNGARPGATTLAQELGVVVWGPDEIEAKVGRASVLGLQNRPMVEEVGFPRSSTPEASAELVAKATSGRLGIGKEDVVWQVPVWMPVVVVQLDLSRVRVLGSKTAISQKWAVYDLIGGTFVTGLESAPERTPVQLDGPTVAPALRFSEPAKTLGRILDKFDSVKSDDARIRYRQQMADLGIPSLHTASVGTSQPYLYPIHLAVARQKNTERLIVVDAFRSRVDDDLSAAFSKVMSHVRDSLGPLGESGEQ